MLPDSLTEVRIKPRILIADDSRIVRATLIKHIEGMFEFREALDGEQAWQMLLVDPRIRVVITDLTMPKLDGYGLLQRIRNSRINRIRRVPVIVLSGSDEQQERDRAMAAGATELISKGVAAARLLSRLDTLTQLANTQQEYERGLDALLQNAPALTDLALTPAADFAAAAAAMLAHALRHDKNFVLLAIQLGAVADAGMASQAGIDERALHAIGQLLQRTVRQSDSVARTGATEFMLATHCVDPESAYGFAQRICGAIGHARLLQQDGARLVASCGLVYLSETATTSAAPAFDTICDTARRRATLGLQRGVSTVIGALDEMPNAD